MGRKKGTRREEIDKNATNGRFLSFAPQLNRFPFISHINFRFPFTSLRINRNKIKYIYYLCEPDAVPGLDSGGLPDDVTVSNEGADGLAGSRSREVGDLVGVKPDLS